MKPLSSGCATARIFWVTADVMREDIDRCRAAGTNGHVPKPLDQSWLIAAVQTALCGGERSRWRWRLKLSFRLGHIPARFQGPDRTPAAFGEVIKTCS